MHIITYQMINYDPITNQFNKFHKLEVSEILILVQIQSL